MRGMGRSCQGPVTAPPHPGRPGTAPLVTAPGARPAPWHDGSMTVAPPPTATGAASYPVVRDLLGGAPFRRLLAVRLTTQLADGGFEVALASLFFFSPE